MFLTSGMVAIGVLFDYRRRSGVLTSVGSSTETIGALPTAEAVADILGIETLSPQHHCHRQSIVAAATTDEHNYTAFAGDCATDAAAEELAPPPP